MTRRASRNVLAQIDALERQIQATDDAEIEGWTDELSKEEKTIVQPSSDEKLKDEGDQNGKAQDNWPLTSSEKERIARTLLKCASMLLAEDDDEEEDDD
jgi:hypothetical protein